MSAVVNIHKGIVPWICSIADPMAVSTNVATLEKWNNGTKPTLAQVSKMSRDLNVPFGYFFLSYPHEDSNDSIAFRTFENKARKEMSTNLRDTIKSMEVIQEWLKNEIADDEFLASPIAGILSEKDDIQSASQKLRALLQIDLDWYRKINKTRVYSFLREKVGENQVFVFESGIVGSNTKKALDINEFRAFALYDTYAPLIFINASDHMQAKSFSLLHEIVHIAIGQNDLMEGGYIEEESFCNSVAAEIMVPTNNFTDFWMNEYGEPFEKLVNASSVFKCSISVVTLRAYKLGLISRDECSKQLNVINQNVRKTSKNGGNFYSTLSSGLDHKFLSLLFASVHEGKTRYTDAYRMTGCWGKTFDRLMTEVLE